MRSTWRKLESSILNANAAREAIGVIIAVR